MPDNNIIVEDIHKSFGDVHALRGVTLCADAGRIFGLLGPNGAGKTTLVRILTTLMKPDAGRALVAGIDVAQNAPALRSLIGLAGQYPAVDEQLTGRENLDIVGRLYHLKGREAKARAAELLAQFDLTDAADRPVKTYSGGMRRRLDLAASIVARPRVLFLDEPTTGLDTRARTELWAVIRDLVRDGTTLLLTTQYLEEADELADYIAVIDLGSVIAQGTADTLKSQFGSDLLEVRVAERDQLEHAAGILADLGAESPKTDANTGSVTIAVEHGAKSLVEAVRLLDAQGVAIADLGVRRPSLDEVFLALTGQNNGSKS